MPFISSVRGATAQEIHDYVDEHEQVADRTVLTSGAGAKGAWVQIDAAALHKVEDLIVAIAEGSANTWYKVDIGTGPGGSEAVLLSNLLLVEGYHLGAAYGWGMAIYKCHVGDKIPLGTRITARVESGSGAADTCRISVWEEQAS